MITFGVGLQENTLKKDNFSIQANQLHFGNNYLSINDRTQDFFNVFL